MVGGDRRTRSRSRDRSKSRRGPSGDGFQGSSAATDRSARRDPEPGAVRVALVVGQLSVGGTERQVHELARTFRATPVQPIVVSLTDRVAPFGTRLRQAGVTVVALDHTALGVPGRVRALARLFRAAGVDLVHSFGDAAGAFSVAATLGLRLPHVHSVRSGRRGRPLWSALLRGLVAHRAAAVTANSEALRREMVSSYRLRPSRVYLTPNGVDMDRFSGLDPAAALRRDLGLTETARVVAYVGRAHPTKDIPSLVDVIRQVDRRWSERADPPCFVLVGRGLEAQAGRLAASLRRATIRHVGVIADADRVISACDILLLTSRSEGMPNVVLEAMAAGKAVVATRAGGIPEAIVDGRTGRLAPVGDARALATALLALSTDDEARDALGRRARTRVRRLFSPAAARDAVCGVYRDVLGVRPRARQTPGVSAARSPRVPSGAADPPEPSRPPPP